jgi:hypothetical protein
MPDNFQYDVFLSHNQADKPRVRRLAERLRAAGLRGFNFGLQTSHLALPKAVLLRDPANPKSPWY